MQGQSLIHLNSHIVISFLLVLIPLSAPGFLGWFLFSPRAAQTAVLAQWTWCCGDRKGWERVGFRYLEQLGDNCLRDQHSFLSWASFISGCFPHGRAELRIRTLHSLCTRLYVSFTCSHTTLTCKPRNAISSSRSPPVKPKCCQLLSEPTHRTPRGALPACG